MKPLGLQVQYASLPNYEDREEEFLLESGLLQQRFTTSGTLLITLHLLQAVC